MILAESVPVEIGRFSVNATALLVVMFLLGSLLRLLQRAGRAFRSQVSTYPSRWCFVVKNWDVFLIRWAISGGFFTWWLTNPGALSNMMVYCGIAPGVANWLTIPPTLATAALFGFMGDLGLDELQSMIATSPKFAWVPSAFKGEIPSYDAAVVEVERLSPDRKVGE